MAEEVLKLEELVGKDMLILGSSSIVSTLTRLGLIDEYEFMVSPVVLGRGRSQFEGLDGGRRMKLINAKTLQQQDCASWIPADEVEIVMTNKRGSRRRARHSTT